jgi:predicted acetyltransferase
MDDCALLKPDASMCGEIKAYRQEFLDTGDSMDGTGPLLRMEHAEDWLAFNRDAEDETKKPENWVVSEQFAYVRKSDGKTVGMIQFRHYFNDFLERYGGHIGYSVRPGERKKGYAKRMLSECLNVCRTFGLENALITCLVDNEASRRTILANGGVYESTVFCERDGVYLQRYWIKL